MINLLKRIVPDFSRIEESPLTRGGEIIGHQSVIIQNSGYPFAGGTAENLQTARRICSAEAIERSFVEKFRRGTNEMQRTVLFNEAPTSCGFAAGFEARATAFRAICEAVERWAWSKWVDEGFGIELADYVCESDFDLFFSSDFETVFTFQQPLILDGALVPDFMPIELIFNVAIGVSGGGVFPGSRVTTVDDRLWSHPLIEAWRHLKIFNGELQRKELESIFEGRIQHFGLSGKGQIAKLTSLDVRAWPKPKLKLLKEVESREGFFVWRALCEDYLNWEKGDVSRFIY